MEWIKEIIFAIKHGKLSYGCEQWKGKPQLSFVRMYHDGWLNVVHIGPLWVELDY